jgi:hypothetical protein
VRRGSHPKIQNTNALRPVHQKFAATKQSKRVHRALWAHVVSALQLPHTTAVNQPDTTHRKVQCKRLSRAPSCLGEVGGYAVCAREGTAMSTEPRWNDVWCTLPHGGARAVHRGEGAGARGCEPRDHIRARVRGTGPPGVEGVGVRAYALYSGLQGQGLRGQGSGNI